MSKSKTGGKTRQKANRAGRRLGLKVSGGQKVSPGQIIVRQRGNAFQLGEGVSVGRDHTIFALKEGTVQFQQLQGKKKISVC